MTARSPKINDQSGKYLDLRVPRKSRPELLQQIQYWNYRNYNCGCLGTVWARRSGNLSRVCHHFKKTTVVPDPNAATMLMRLKSLLLSRNTFDNDYLWSLVKCTRPNDYYSTEIHCTHCSLYPYWCNIHPVRFKRSAKPVVWKIQTAIYNGRRNDAVRLIKVLIKNIQEVQ